MIICKSSDWREALRHPRPSGVIRLLLKRVLLVGLYAAAVTAAVIRFDRVNIQIDKEFFSFMSIMLSLPLVFRTNTAYDRLYEGRRLRGQLVNSCRNLAVLLHARLPVTDHANRTCVLSSRAQVTVVNQKGTSFRACRGISPGSSAPPTGASEIPRQVRNDVLFYPVSYAWALGRNVPWRVRSWVSRGSAAGIFDRCGCRTHRGAFLRHHLLPVRARGHALVLFEQGLEVGQVVEPRPQAYLGHAGQRMT